MTPPHGERPPDDQPGWQPHGQHYPQPIPYGPDPRVPTRPPPPSNLAWAIVTAVLCCAPLSVVSIIYASKVDRLWMLGQHDEAIRASRLARNWAIASAGALVLPIVVLFVLELAGALD